MPYLTVASGDLLTAAQWNTNVRDQTISSCTSLTRPTSPVSGQYIYETDTLYTYYWNNTAWTLVPPTASPTFTGTPAAPTATAGTNTTQLATTAFVTTAIPALNLIINGAMQVTQRSAVGTAVPTLTTAGYYTADRFNLDISGFGTFSQTTIADAPTGSGFRNSLKMDCTTAQASPAAGAYLTVQHKIEGQNLQAIRKGTASAQKLTLSFWVKSFQTGTFIAELYDQDNTRSVSKAYTVAVSNTWEYKTILFPADTTGAFDNDSNSSLIVVFWLGAGTNFTSGTLATTWGTSVNANRAVGQTNVASAATGEWFMTGASFTVGDADVPFQFKSFADDLAACQRYYEKSYADGVATATNTATGVYYQSSFGNASGQHFITVRFQTLKRANPTVSLWTQAGGVGAWAVISSPQPAPGYAGAASVINTTTKAFTVNQSDGGYAWQGGQTLGHWEAASEL